MLPLKNNNRYENDIEDHPECMTTADQVLAAGTDRLLEQARPCESDINLEVAIVFAGYEKHLSQTKTIHVNE